MSDVLYKCTINSPLQYYLDYGQNDIDVFLNGIIINICNINYIVTTYLPTNDIKISSNDINFNVSGLYSNFLFNLSIFKIDDKIITNNVYGNRNFCLKLNKSNKNNNMFILNETKDVNITSCELKYELYQKFDFIPETLIIKTYVEDHTGIDSGCAVIKIDKKNTHLIGIVSHIEFDSETDKYIIYIIPCYTIIKAIKNFNYDKLSNLWLDINENNVVTNIKSTYKCYSSINVGDTINKIDNCDIINGKIHVKTINMNIPVSTYLWYNQHIKKANTFSVLINDKNILEIEYKTVDDILTVNFQHNKSHYEYNIDINKTNYFINLQCLSYELMDYMISKDVYIDNETVFNMFENPYRSKIKNLLVTNHNIFREVTIVEALNENSNTNDTLPIKLKLLDLVVDVENTNINQLWQFNYFLMEYKKKYHKNEVNIKLINENNTYESIIKLS